MKKAPSVSPPARAVPTKLKAERIQRFLAENPDWSLAPDRRTLSRAYDLANRAAALAFVGWIAETSQAFRKSPWVSTQGSGVEITIHAQAREFTARELDLARALSLACGSRRKAA